MSASSYGATDQLATPPVGPAPAVAEIKRGRWGDLWRAISRNRKALAGVLLLLLFVVLAIFPGQIAPYNGQAEIFTPALGPSRSICWVRPHTGRTSSPRSFGVPASPS